MTNYESIANMQWCLLKNVHPKHYSASLPVQNAKRQSIGVVPDSHGGRSQSHIGRRFVRRLLPSPRWIVMAINLLLLVGICVTASGELWVRYHRELGLASSRYYVENSDMIAAHTVTVKKTSHKDPPPSSVTTDDHQDTSTKIGRAKIVQQIMAQNSNHNRQTQMDYQGAGHVQFAYRLGDVFDLWYLHQYDMTFDELVKLYQSLYPGTIAYEYLVQVGSRPYAHRNLTALLQVLQRHEEPHQHDHNNNPSQPRPGAHDLVVHLRLGDVLTSDCCTDLNRTIDEMWYAPTGFVNHDCDIKHNYNRVEMEQLLQRLPVHAGTIETCVIVGAVFVTTSQYDYRNRRYRDLVSDLLQQRLGCRIQLYDNPNPDETLRYMAAAKWILVAMGGFSQIAAALVQARGQGVVLHDKFNGHIAGWNSEFFSAYERRVFVDHYIDWSRVDVPLTEGT